MHEWYKAELAGWEIMSQSTIETDDGKFASINASRNNYELSVTLTESDEGTAVILGVGEK